MDKVDCVVVGAGVIGLAIARRLAQAGREVIVLEAAEGIGTVTSSRNSEVIHAGIYYRAGSLMAQMCVSGRRALYRVLPRSRRSPSQLRQADRGDDTAGNRKTAVDPGACRSQWRRRSAVAAGEAARALEPALNCDAALLSPSTGIIDSHAYMLALQGDAEEAGAAYAFHTPLLHARAVAGRIEIEAGGDAPMTLACDLLVNAAGLGAPAVARSIEGMPIELIPCRLSRQGKLFQLQRAGAVFAPDLSGAGARRAGRAPHARHGGTGPVRSRRGMGREHRLCRRSGPCGADSIPPSGATGRRCRTAR